MKSPFSPLQRLFIYDRREMVVLTTLCLVTALFTFTLGIHLGKDVGTPAEASAELVAKHVAAIPDQVPAAQELVGPNKATQQALEESLYQTLHDEVVRTGIHLKAPYQIDLPENSKGHDTGSDSEEQTTSENEDTPSTEGNRKISSVDETETEAAPTTKESHTEVAPYVIQVGSFPKLKEAEKKISELTHLELKPFMKEVDVKGKGKWFRLYLGNYSTKLAAEKAGKSYIAQHKIKSFIVSKIDRQ
ncbi:MAG: SPOR domain-containing protein [Bdellovibrionia bacterium]